MSESVPPSMADIRSALAESDEEAWLNRLADEAESEGTEGAVSLEEMAALLRTDQG